MCIIPFQRHSCNPVLLFDAEVEKYCPDNMMQIKVCLFTVPLKSQKYRVIILYIVFRWTYGIGHSVCSPILYVRVWFDWY